MRSAYIAMMENVLDIPTQITSMRMVDLRALYIKKYIESKSFLPLTTSSWNNVRLVKSSKQLLCAPWLEEQQV